MSKRARITDQTRRDVLLYVKQHPTKTFTDVAKIFGCHASTIGVIVRKGNTTQPPLQSIGSNLFGRLTEVERKLDFLMAELGVSPLS